MRTFEIPEAVQKRVRLAGTQDWLASLPAVVAALEDEWSITVGESFSGGSEALVAAAVMHDGTQAILKLLMPHDQGRQFWNPAGRLRQLLVDRAAEQRLVDCAVRVTQCHALHLPLMPWSSWIVRGPGSACYLRFASNQRCPK